ncbi:hypothetical protein CSOJ01_06870 [Colletotrichum sojae]|uniref:Uncharacterized protein n=1 Tax=Colletotrichum sojae TaxID=2175907 RepID=A0A8H6MUI1_9PEZI|nr:hypothetical protein CSOJ01_06870 [Colletotrichum sojae]
MSWRWPGGERTQTQDWVDWTGTVCNTTDRTSAGMGLRWHLVEQEDAMHKKPGGGTDGDDVHGLRRARGECRTAIRMGVAASSGIKRHQGPSKGGGDAVDNAGPGPEEGGEHGRHRRLRNIPLKGQPCPGGRRGLKVMRREMWISTPLFSPPGALLRLGASGLASAVASMLVVRILAPSVAPENGWNDLMRTARALADLGGYGTSARWMGNDATSERWTTKICTGRIDVMTPSTTPPADLAANTLISST